MSLWNFFKRNHEENSFPKPSNDKQREAIPREEEPIAEQINLPGFLLKPNDPISRKMYGDGASIVEQPGCNYSIEINSGYYSHQPKVKQVSDFETIHIYAKSETPSWQTVTTMKHPTVPTFPLEGFVSHKYRLSQMLNVPTVLISVPDGWEILNYESLKMVKLGSWEAYDLPRKLDESVVFCHIFRLNGQIYKDYILCARQQDYAWKLDCYFQSQTGSELSPVDFAVPGYMFGSFFPLQN